MVALPLEDPRGSRARYLREWLSFWSSRPLLPPDLVHFRAFVAWLRLGYRLLALAAVATWLIDELWSGSGSPAPFFAGVIFGVAPSVLHFVRSMSSLPSPTRLARFIAGWPLEFLMVVLCVMASQAIFS